MQKDNPAFFPLAIPVIAGPGAMATVILYSQHAKGIAGMVTIGAVILLMCAVLLVALRAAGALSNHLGRPA